MWRELGRVALAKRDLIVAERAYAAVGDIAKGTFIQECGEDHYKIALLENDWNAFEAGDFDTVIETYIKLHMWERAIDKAFRSGRLDAQRDLERRYYDYLLDTHQEAAAAKLMEKSGNVEDAIKLYIKAGHAVKAARVSDCVN